MNRSARGYTLVEVLLSVSLIGIVALVAIPDLSSTSEVQLEVAAQELADAIEFARGEALRTNTAHGVDIGTGQKRIRVFSADTSTSPPTPVYDVYHPVSRKLYDIRFDDSSIAALGGINRATTTNGACSQPERIIFNNRGVAFCGDPYSSLYLQADFTLTLDRSSNLVSMQGITGRVTVQ